MSDPKYTKWSHIRLKGHPHFNEAWVKERIVEDTSILGLGNLKVRDIERIQKRGRLDLLLVDDEDEDDLTWYEVEVQLGETDPSHIIRTIKYWDNEKRRWPNRSHTAVLVAETITSRFFNVVHLLSKAVPIIGIQANLVEVGAVKGLHFTKVIDSYEEPEEEEAPQQIY